MEFQDVIVSRGKGEGIVELAFGMNGDTNSPLLVYITEAGFKKMLIREQPILAAYYVSP